MTDFAHTGLLAADRRTAPPARPPGGVGDTPAATGMLDFCRSYYVRASIIIGLLVFADCANVLSVSTLDFEKQVKYAYFLFAISLYALTFLTTSRLVFGFDGPTLLLGFTFCSVMALVFQLISPVQNNSYAGAFLAPLLLSTAAIVDIERITFDPVRIGRVLQKFLLALSVLYVIELAIRSFSGLEYFEVVVNQTNHIKSFVFVASACLAILLRDPRGLGIAGVLFVASEILRPSSSLISGLLICAPVSLAISWRWIRLARTMAYAVLIVAALTPIALHLSPDLEAYITDAETWTKQDVLQGTSNTLFRLAIQDMAIDQLQESSIAFGAMFSSSNSVQLSNKLAWWLEFSPDGVAAIHSDYVSVLFQSGVVGYLFYNLALFLTCGFLFRGIERAQARDQPFGIIGLAICSVLILVFYSSSNPFLQYYIIAHVVWFLVGLGYIQVRIDRADDRRRLDGPRVG